MKISRLLRALRSGCRQGNEGIYPSSILYRISVSKLINSTQYVIFFFDGAAEALFTGAQVTISNRPIIQYVYGCLNFNL